MANLKNTLESTQPLLKSGKSEKEITTIFLKRARSLGDGWFYKIADIGNTMKPFDIVGVYKGKAIAIEAKYIKTKKIPSYDDILGNLEPHQVMNLHSFSVSGGESYLLSYHNGSYNLYHFITN